MRGGRARRVREVGGVQEGSMTIVVAGRGGRRSAAGGGEGGGKGEGADKLERGGKQSARIKEIKSRGGGWAHKMAGGWDGLVLWVARRRLVHLVEAAAVCLRFCAGGAAAAARCGGGGGGRGLESAFRKSSSAESCAPAEPLPRRVAPWDAPRSGSDIRSRREGSSARGAAGAPRPPAGAGGRSGRGAALDFGCVSSPRGRVSARAPAAPPSSAGGRRASKQRAGRKHVIRHGLPRGAPRVLCVNICCCRPGASSRRF